MITWKEENLLLGKIQEFVPATAAKEAFFCVAGYYEGKEREAYHLLIHAAQKGSFTECLSRLSRITTEKPEEHIRNVGQTIDMIAN